MRRLAEALAILGAAALFAGVVLPPAALIGGSEPEQPAAGLLPLDDAYIFIRFAQQFDRGRPFEWSDGVRSSGATSLGYLALLLPGRALGGTIGDWARWSRWIGVASLALLGLAVARLLAALALPPPWPLAGGLTVALSGPVGWGALAGMESALNAAGVALAAACWARLAPGGDEGKPGRGTFAAAALAAAVLPWLRPENLALAGVAAVAILLAGGWRGRRLWAPVALLPGGLLLALDWWLTGDPRPAGGIVKSITEFAFLDPGTLAALYGFNLSRKLLPAYLGARGEVLWPPVGWLALLAAAWIAVAAARPAAAGSESARQAARRALPVAAAWAVLVLIGPLSAVLDWQLMRHHHAGLVLAWVLALWAAARGFERLRLRRGWGPGSRRAALAAPLLLLAALPLWRAVYAHGQQVVHRRHGPAAAWLARQDPKPLLLLNDAGFLMVHHDGPAIDALGLGTPAMARPARNGPGAMAEALARLPAAPDVAAVNLDSFRLEQLLGSRLLAPPEFASDTVLAEVRGALLRRTALAGPGLDFGHLPDERRWQARWTVEPNPLEASFAVIHDAGDAETLDGCRPVPERVSWRMPETAARGAVRVFAPPAAAAEVAVLAGDGGRLAVAAVPAGGAAELVFERPAGGETALARLSGGLPCIESVAFLSQLRGSR